MAEAEIGAGALPGPPARRPRSALKDLFATRGVVTTGGSPILRHWVPDEDAVAVARWREAGAVFLGKNTLHEFAFGGTSVNAHTGTPRNPWDPGRIAGGSSGGSAAAVAAGFAFGAMGSETGNSVRRPAAFCGVLGLKPTFGRLEPAGSPPPVLVARPRRRLRPHARPTPPPSLAPLSGYDPADPGSRRPPAARGRPGHRPGPRERPPRAPGRRPPRPPHRDRPRRWRQPSRRPSTPCAPPASRWWTSTSPWPPAGRPSPRR